MRPRCLFLMIVCLAMFVGTAQADTLPAGASKVVTAVNGTFTPTSGSTGSSGSIASGAFGSADLTTGELKVFTQGTNTPSASAYGFEFLTFSTNTTVSYG